MPRTLAFSHKGGYWKTRYSFYSYCYAFIDRIFLSFNQTFGRDPVYRHDSDAVGRTVFYGDPAAGSAIAFTFNEKPSRNKIYKAMSLESTPNVNGVSVITVNNSTVPDASANTNATVIQNRGGILYGDVGFDNRLTNANVKAVGVVTDIAFNAGVNILAIDFLDGGWSYNQGDDVKYFLGSVSYDDEGNTSTTYFQFAGNVPINISTYAAIPATLQIGGLVNPIGTNMLAMVGGEITDPQTPNLILYSATPGEDNGEQARGQTADVVLTLGSQPYELYALNMLYEETDLDHREDPAAPRRQAASQKRRRR
jgi:hypothetical protein